MQIVSWASQPVSDEQVNPPPGAAMTLISELSEIPVR